MQQLPDGSLAIPTVNFTDNSGCIETIATTGTPASTGCLLDNATMSDYASGMAVDGDTLFVVVPSTDFVHSTLFSYGLTSHAFSAALSPTNEVIGDVATCPGGKIVVTDKGTTPGLRFYDATGTETTLAPIDVGLKPQSTPSLACY